MTIAERNANAPQLRGPHLRTYQAIFQQHAAHNLGWSDVRSLLESLTDLTQESNGNLKATRNGQTLTLSSPKNKAVATTDDLNRIRHFLERSDEVEALPPTATGEHLLVVIDHEEAKVYRTEIHGSVPKKIVPHDPHGYGRHLHHSRTDGKRSPEQKSYYEAVAKTMQGAERILLFGSGTGGSAMQQLLADLNQFHPDLSRRVIGSVVVDSHHTTEDQLLAVARDFYIKNQSNK